MSSVKKRSLASAFKSLLRYRLLLPIVLASLLILTAVSYFAAHILETQQERFNASISYTIEDFILLASHELDAIAFTIPHEITNISMQAQWNSLEIFDTLYLLNDNN